MPIHSICFSFPTSKIRPIREKTRTYCPIEPGNKSTYVQGEETYMDVLGTSAFCRTKSMWGWDCWRHLEILAAGSVPIFDDLDSCPETTLVQYPKKELLKRERADPQVLRDHFLRHLTCSAMNRYVLETLNETDRPTDRPTLFDATRAPNQTDPSRPDANAISFSITTIRHRFLLGIPYISPRSANRRIGESDDRTTISPSSHDIKYDRHVFRIVRKRHVRSECEFRNLGKYTCIQSVRLENGKWIVAFCKHQKYGRTAMDSSGYARSHPCDALRIAFEKPSRRRRCRFSEFVSAPRFERCLVLDGLGHSRRSSEFDHQPVNAQGVFRKHELLVFKIPSLRVRRWSGW